MNRGKKGMEKVHNHNMMKTNQEKDKKIIENQAKYNPAMVNQTKRNDESGGDTDVLENSDQEVTVKLLCQILFHRFQ